MSQMRYDGQVAIITGSGNGLGKEYAKYLASRGAKVVVNDLGGTFNGKPGADAAVADVVVKEIRNAGGVAVANYDSVLNGDRIVKTAMDNFGRIDILINNAGILRDVTIRNMKDEDWDVIMDVHVHGAFKVTRAAWPYFRKQRHGRIINTSSASGLFGNFGQSNYAAAKMALVGLSETLAKEGAKYNITSNALAPGAASRLTQTVWSPEMMDIMKPDWVIPLVATLVHSSCKESGSIFEASAGHYSKIRWERSKGFVANPESLSTDLILQNWHKVTDWTGADHPMLPSDQAGLFEKAKKLPKSPATTGGVSFKDRVVLVTGGGAGLGRAYALLFAKLGAKVAVNDVVNAEKVAEEIKKSWGEAIAITKSVEEGASIVKAVADAYNRIDVVVNNAGILGDKAFANMTDEQWHTVLNVHLRGTYLITRAAWPYMMKQRYGRIVNITSTSGIYGNFGQANYAAAKCGIVGFTKTLGREGQKYNIIVNTVAPSAGTNMTRTVWQPEMVQALIPEFVAPLVAALCCEKPPAGASGQIYEAGAGWFAATRWQRARGVDFEHAQGVPSAEDLAKAFPEIINFDNGQADNPDTPQEGSRWNTANIMKNPKVAELLGGERANRRYISKISQAIELKPISSIYSYDDRDVILYNISLGAHRTDLDLVYEGNPNFSALPTFGIVPTYYAKAAFETKDIVPNYDQRMLLHGEQYLEIRTWPIPTKGELTTETKLIEVVDKGNAALVRRGSTTRDASGKDIFYNEGLAFIRGSGGFGGQKKPTDRGAATAANIPPKRSPDKVVEEKTSEDIAALYRLMGDRNPLHIDPEFSAKGGFKIPILHGLATFGISGKHVYQSYGPYKNIKVRFSGTVLPGETIVTEMWKEGNKIVYQVKIKETGKLAISGAGAELLGAGSKL